MTGPQTRLNVHQDDGVGVALALGGAEVFKPSSLFRLEVDRQRRQRLTDAVLRADQDEIQIDGDVEGTTLHVTWRATRIAGSDAWEFALRLRNDGPTVNISRLDPVAAQLAGGVWEITAFRSTWGEEFVPEHATTESDVRFETRAGRSSHGYSPLLALKQGGSAMLVAPAWSGNWHIDITEGQVLTAGISDWLFETELEAGMSLEAPSVVVAFASSIDQAGVEMSSAIGRAWAPRSPASERFDVEWNHWWPYEDVHVNESVIVANSVIADRVGIDMVTVDAGWFGPSERKSSWPRYRGDWERVNEARFPAGLPELARGVRANGVRTGIWIEAEAIGRDATIRRERPEIVALAPEGPASDPSYQAHGTGQDPDDPTFLGYVCCGSEAGRRFVAESLERTVKAFDAEWVKLDFNVDPGAGCTRTDHGHGPMDGLFRHYEGLYTVLDEFRAAHPEVVLEGCASGGLRVDLGLARHVHCLFMSDPDYTEHALQTLWGASHMLPPSSILHFSWSQWVGDHEPSRLDFSTLADSEFRATLRSAMLHRFGVSLRLPELPQRLVDVLGVEVRRYHQTFLPLVRDGVMRRLTAQPLRGGQGERTPAFQLSLSSRHAVVAFQLEGSSGVGTVMPAALEPNLLHSVTDLDTGSVRHATGAELMSDGLTVPARIGRLSSAAYLIESV